MGAQNNNSFNFTDWINTSVGADGVLRDVRVIKTSDNKFFLVIANRDLNESYASEEPVNFNFYFLFDNRKWDKDGPDYFLEYIGSVKAKDKYIDVNEAMDKELSGVVSSVLQKQ